MKCLRACSATAKVEFKVNGVEHNLGGVGQQRQFCTLLAVLDTSSGYRIRAHKTPRMKVSRVVSIPLLSLLHDALN